MEPELSPGDYVLANRWAYRRGDPAKGDVVVFRDPEGHRFLVKRVAEAFNGNAYFVVGDNLAASRDSRSFGPVPRELIVGRVWRRVKP